MHLYSILFVRVDSPPQWCSGRAYASHAGDRGLILGWDRPESLKQEVTAPLPNARQQV